MKYDYKNPPEKTLRFWLNCIASQLFVEPRDMAKWVREKEKCCSKVFSTTEMIVIEENKKNGNIDAETLLEYPFLYYTEHLKNYEKGTYSSTFTFFKTLSGLEDFKKESINNHVPSLEFVLHDGALLPYKEGDRLEDGRKLYHTSTDRGIDDYNSPSNSAPFIEFDLYEVDKGNRVYCNDNSLASIQLRINEEIAEVVTKEDRKVREGNVIELLKDISNYKIRRGTEYIDFRIGLFSKEKEIQIYKGEVIKDNGFEIVDSLGVEIIEMYSR